MQNCVYWKTFLHRNFMTETSYGNVYWFLTNNERIQEACLYLYVTADRYARKHIETVKLQAG